MAKVKTTCAKCGKEFEADEKLINWMDNVKGERICSECFSRTKNQPDKKNADEKRATVKKSNSASGMTAEEFRKVYDEFVAAFADILDDIKPHIGGWVSTILINSHKKF